MPASSTHTITAICQQVEALLGDFLALRRTHFGDIELTLQGVKEEQLAEALAARPQTAASASGDDAEEAEHALVEEECAALQGKQPEQEATATSTSSEAAVHVVG